MRVLELATMHDVPRIMAQVAKLWEKSNSATKLGDPIEAELSIRYAVHQERAFLYDNVFFFFEVGELFYSNAKILFEQLVLKLGPMEGSFADVVAQFDVVAQRLGCKYVVVGDSQAGSMVPRYEACGYKTSAVQLMKEVPIGKSSQVV